MILIFILIDIRETKEKKRKEKNISINKVLMFCVINVCLIMGEMIQQHNKHEIKINS